MADCNGLLGFSVVLLRAIRWPAEGNAMRTTSGSKGCPCSGYTEFCQPGRQANSFRIAGVTCTGTGGSMAWDAV